MNYIYEVEQKSLAQRIRDDQSKRKALLEAKKAKTNQKMKIKNTILSIIQVTITMMICLGIMVVMGLFDGM
jgi:hypothetical protein